MKGIEVGTVRKAKAIAQGVGYVTGYALDTVLNYPVLFRVASTITGDVRVLTWDNTVQTIDCQELDRDHTLIRCVYDHADTDLTVDQFRLLK